MSHLPLRLTRGSVIEAGYIQLNAHKPARVMKGGSNLNAQKQAMERVVPSTYLPQGFAPNNAMIVRGELKTQLL